MRPLPARGFARGEAGERGFPRFHTRIPGCARTTARNGMGKKAKPSTIEGVAGSLRVNYPDERIAPKVCNRTGMKRWFCVCTPCRKLRRRKHRASCRCWLCYSDRMGEFIDDLGGQTLSGCWRWFLTLTFRTRDSPWGRGFRIEQPKPYPDFVHEFFKEMILWIEREVHARVEYFTADQFGELGGRLHLHCGLSWPGLFEYRWKDLQKMLLTGTGSGGILHSGAGYNVIRPWVKDAGYYIGRYIGRDAERSDWDFRVGSEQARPAVAVGRRVLVESRAPDNSSREYRRTLGRLHK
jgi:hypothetical protein